MSRYETVAPEGQPTHVTEVRIAGVETGSDRYNALLDQYRGALSHFQLAQQQQVSISGQRYYKASRSVPGARMTYQNNEGQETLTLQLTTAGGGEEVQIDKDAYWSWAIVEVTIPNIMGLTSSVASAFMTPPPKNKLGYALNNSPPIDVDKPPLSYPSDGLGTLIGDVQDNTYPASLRVDLRPYPGGVKFDLYGYIRRYQDGTVPGDPTNPQRAMWRGSNGVSKSTTYTLLNGITQSWWSSSDISGRTQTNYQYKTSGSPSTTLTDIGLAFPAIAGPFSTTAGMPAPYGAAWSGDGPGYAGLSITWTPGHNTSPDASTMNLSGLEAAAGGIFTETTTTQPDGVSYAVRGIGMQTYTTNFSTGVDTVLNGAGPTDSMGNWGIEFFDYTIYHVAQHPTVPNYIYPQRDCPVNFVVLDDGPDEMTNRVGSPLKDSSYRWEASKKYPDRWPMRQIGTVHMVGIDDSGLPSPTPANHYSMVKLGTVIIHPRKGKGGIKFIAA